MRYIDAVQQLKGDGHEPSDERHALYCRPCGAWLAYHAYSIYGWVDWVLTKKGASHCPQSGRRGVAAGSVSNTASNTERQAN